MATKRDDFNEIMAFSWYEICDDEYKVLINTDKLESCIKKYGVNAHDKNYIHLHCFLEFMTEEQINMVISNNQFDPEMSVYQGLFYPSYGSDQRDHVFKVLLDHDIDGRYLHEKVYYRVCKCYGTVIEYIKKYLITCYNEHPNNRRMSLINSLEYQKMLFENHRLKKMTLFDMILSYSEEIDKRARFQ